MAKALPPIHGRDHAPGGPDPIPNWPTGGGTDFGALTQVIPLPLIVDLADSSGFSWTQDNAYTGGGYLGCNASGGYFTFLVYLGPKGSVYGVRMRYASDVDFAKFTVSMASLKYEARAAFSISGDESGKIQPTSGGSYGTVSQVDMPGSTIDAYAASFTENGGFHSQMPFIVGGAEGDTLTSWTAGGTDPLSGYSITDGGPGWYKAKVRVNGRNVSNTTGYKLRFTSLAVMRLDDDGYA